MIDIPEYTEGEAIEYFKDCPEWLLLLGFREAFERIVTIH